MISHTIPPRPFFFAILAAISLLLTACGVYVPEGATVVEIENVNREFDRAEMRPLNALRADEFVQLKWYDTNVYMTTGTLTPGTWRFVARRFDGGGMQRDIEIVAGKNRYVVDGGNRAESQENEEPSSGPPLTGRLVSTPARHLPVSVSILFIGERIEMREAVIQRDGTFSSNFPRDGIWRVEIHSTGNPPYSYVRERQQVQGGLDLGDISLR